MIYINMWVFVFKREFQALQEQKEISGNPGKGLVQCHNKPSTVFEAFVCIQI